MKTALITGFAGMDGSHLGDLLLEKGYRVVGMVRRNATRSLGNAAHLEGRVEIVEGDVTDLASVMSIIRAVEPDEIYNLAAMSHVHTSFGQPVATFAIDTIGVVNVLEAVRMLGIPARIFQASTSELWGDSPPPQTEATEMRPRSPYAIAKLAAHWMVRLYREAYGMWCAAGITHNHESERRGPLFVTRKISMGVARCLVDPSHRIRIGNLDAKRDWGYAPDYVRGFWMMLQRDQPDDFLFGTNEMHTVREFIEEAFSHAGAGDWRDRVVVDSAFRRPAEVDALQGDCRKAREVLGWEPKVKFRDLVHRMVDHDIALVRGGVSIGR